MAISLTFQQIAEKFNPKYWDSIDEFEEFYLQDILERSYAGRIYYTDRNGKNVEHDAICHWPELKEYEIWMEGFAATGQSAIATLCDKVKARNFAEAVHIHECKSYLKHVEEQHKTGSANYDAGRWDYDPNKLSQWGCRYYWSEKLAKKSFG